MVRVDRTAQPADDLAGKHIAEQRGIDVAIGQWHIGNIRNPQLVGSICAEIPMHKIISGGPALGSDGGLYPSAKNLATEAGEPHGGVALGFVSTDSLVTFLATFLGDFDEGVSD